MFLYRPKSICLAVACSALALPVVTHAAAIPYASIDFGRSDGGSNSASRVEPGFLSYLVDDANDPQPVTGFISDTGDAFTLQADAPLLSATGSSNANARDRGDFDGSPIPALVLMAEEFIGDQDGVRTIDLIFGSLPAGIFEAKTYHVDADFGNVAQAISVSTTGVGGVFSPAATSPAFADPGNEDDLTTALVESSSVTFQFTADGVNDVVFRITPTTATNSAVINGLELTIVPEPASGLLIGLGAVALLGRSRRQSA